MCTHIEPSVIFPAVTIPDLTLQNCHCSGYSKIRWAPGRNFLSRGYLTPVHIFRSFFFLYNGSLSFDSLFGGGGRGKENGLYIFFNSIQCWTVPARYMEVSRWPTPYFSTTSMVQYGTGVLVSVCQHWAYSRCIIFS